MKYLLLPLCIAAVMAEAQSQGPAFEVASVKPNHSGETPYSVRIVPGGSVRALNASLEAIITTAYQIPDFELAGGPAWLTAEKWDIEAKGPGAAPPQRVLEMLQALLADRFQLKIHRESRQMPIYALVVAKGGPKLEPASIECFDPAGGTGPTAPNARPCGGFNRGPAQLLGARIAMPGLAKTLSKVVGRTVVDKTGIAGNYDIALRWNPDEMSPTGQSTAGEPAGMFNAIQEQLGLRLEAQKGPVDMLVIDSVGRASAN